MMELGLDFLEEFVIDVVLLSICSNVIVYLQGFQTNASLVIGHMLGVDHIGHTYYANHPVMERKLK